jgi:hypothetical protein
MSEERDYRHTDRWSGTEIGSPRSSLTDLPTCRLPSSGHDKGRRANASLSPHPSVVAATEPVSGFTT